MQKMEEMQVQPLGWEDHLEKEVATHSSILTSRTPGTKQPGKLQSIGSQRVGHDWSDLTCTQEGLTLERGLKYLLWEISAQTASTILFKNTVLYMQFT